MSGAGRALSDVVALERDPPMWHCGLSGERRRQGRRLVRAQCRRLLRRGRCGSEMRWSHVVGLWLPRSPGRAGGDGCSGRGLCRNRVGGPRGPRGCDGGGAAAVDLVLLAQAEAGFFGERWSTAGSLSCAPHFCHSPCHAVPSASPSLRPRCCLVGPSCPLRRPALPVSASLGPLPTPGLRNYKAPVCPQAPSLPPKDFVPTLHIAVLWEACH